MYIKRLYYLSKNYTFGIWGLIMHLVLLWGVLDANFHSPVVQELSTVPPVPDAPSKRLLLFVADGLRFRTFIENPPKYLRYVMKDKGTWGISHTRMPTESRPGNVAIAAGLYEDPSAIFKGWKENPVEFDSVFNQSQFTWAWGSPDIVPMFTKATGGHVYSESYPSEWQDFDPSQSPLRLDSWVFDKYMEWLRKEGDNAKHLDSIILFFHLLGCDTTGHSVKPHSREYIENMNYVDQRIEEVVQMTESFFGNGSTAYLFTADHGMTDWGSHGSGSSDETETPLVVWGAGVKNNGRNHDVEQAAIAPLISSLIGIPIPVNNEGVLPAQYLANETYAGRVLLNNLKQLIYQIDGNHKLNHVSPEDVSKLQKQILNKNIHEIEEYYKKGDTISAIKKTSQALDVAKDLLLSVRRHHRNRFLIYVSIMWFSWIIYLFFKIAGINRYNVNIRLLKFVNAGFISLFVILLIRYIVAEHITWRLPFYEFFAATSAWLAVRSTIVLFPAFIIQTKTPSLPKIGSIFFLLISMFVGLIFRWVLTAGMLCAVLIQKSTMKQVDNLTFATGLVLAGFPLLPVVEPQSRLYIILLNMSIMAFMIMRVVPTVPQKIIEMMRLSLAGLIYIGFIDGRGWTSWMILITMPFCIWLYPTNIKQRIQGIIIDLFVPLTLLSASYEPLFFLIFGLHLLYWTESDATSRSKDSNSLNLEDLLKATFFMFYTLLSFFGTGNMATISSFDPLWTRHFITVFSPFTMTSLILLKLSIPLVLVGCITNIVGSLNTLLAVLLLGDCLSLPLVYYITPHGSWLDIGIAISRFLIAITLPCLLLLLYYISLPLMKLKLPFHFQCTLEKSHIV